MFWEDVVTLLHAYHETAPGTDAVTNKIHAAARDVLRAVDVNELRFKSQVNDLEPLEDE